MSFEEMGLCPEILHAVADMGFEHPTPVQELTIPYMLTDDSGEDLITLSQTGTGKTASFGFPILEMLQASQVVENIVSTSGRKQVRKSVTRALILAPTRELCVQIAKDLSNYGKYLSLRIVAVYGGEDIRKQLFLLDQTPDILVATPGRLIDLMHRGKVSLSAIKYLVLDEADEMLDMGFKEDLETILQDTPEDRRTMLFSATMPDEISHIARQYMHKAHTIQIGEKNAGTENVDHVYYVCRAQDRYLVLKRIVDLYPDIYGIVFCRTKAETQEVAEKLIKDGYSADALHGDLTQPARDAVMQRFRLRAVQLLVATDVAARGLDVHDLTHVINYMLPDDPEVYTHRSGRTGRAGKRGTSVCIVHQRETRRIQNLERMLHREFRRERIPSGMDVCTKQLFAQVVKLQKADIANIAEQPEEIQKQMHAVYSILEYMPKEELIQRFISLEFNRFIEYYKEAPDLNVPEPKARTPRAERGNSEGSKPAREGSRSSMRGRKVRMKINVGLRDGMTPKRFLGLINDTTQDRTIMVGDIDIKKNYTFFDLYLDQKPRVVKAFQIYEDLTVQEAKGMAPREEYRNEAPHRQPKDKPWRSNSKRNNKR